MTARYPSRIGLLPAGPGSKAGILLRCRTMNPARNRWQRRALTWPLLLLGTPILVVVSPLLFGAAALIDLVRGPRRLATVRTVGMVLSYLVLESLGLLAGFALWLATGGGLAMRSRLSQDLHHRVQVAWADAMLAAICFWFRASIDLENPTRPGKGPLIVIARHTSFFDALLPAVFLGVRKGARIRYVLAAELAWDPCLDLFGQRLPNHFVRRNQAYREADAKALGAMASTVGNDAIVIFPEGTFHTPARAKRAHKWLWANEPHRAERLRLDHLLPPRATGLTALLDNAPDADLLVMGHQGFEPFGSIRDILAHVPFEHPVRVRTWHMQRRDVPPTDPERMAHIDQSWQRLDDWVGTPVPLAEVARDASTTTSPGGTTS